MASTKAMPRGDRGAGGSGPMAWFAGSVCCPALVVVAFLAAALAGPLAERPGAVVARIDLPGGAFASQVAFAPDGKRVYADHKRLGVTILGIDGQALRRGRASGGLDSTGIAVDPTGRALFVALADGTVQVRDPETLAVRATLEGDGDRVMDQAISNDGERLALVDSEGVVRIWGLGDGRLEREFRGPDLPSCCALSPDGRRIALGTRDGLVALIDAATGAERRRWAAHAPGTVTFALRFAPDGRSLASVGQDDALRLWDAEGGEGPRWEVAIPGGPSTCLAIAPDGRSVASGHWDGRVRVWDLATGALIAAEAVDQFQARSVCFAPDGRRLAVASGSSVTVVEVARPA